MSYNLRILDYFQVLEELTRITQNGGFIKQPSVCTNCDNIKIPYYTLGEGDNHIVICGGTHGSEIISVDFVLRLMEEMSKKEGIFSDLDLSQYTFHFIPMQNPEGYIISTSTIRTLIPEGASEEAIEALAKEYFLAYRQDDINARLQPEDKSPKEHQKMFSQVTYECIPEEFPELRQRVKEIYSNDQVPKGSMIVHRGNGLGQETNRSMLSQVLTKPIDSEYGPSRYNNIRRDIPGPLGTAPTKEDVVENKFLKGLLTRLYSEGKYCGMLTYHGTGGLIYSKLSDDDEIILDEELSNEYLEDKYQKSVINRILTRQYQKDTSYVTPSGYEKTGYRMIEEPSLKDFDETLRMNYPAVLLIELSYMGGNPLGPYGDKEDNYVPTMEHNMIAAHNFIKTCKKLKPAIYKEVYITDKEVSEEFRESVSKTYK